MNITKMSLEEAHEVSTWKYDHPYSFYNSDGSAESIEEFMDGTYYAARNAADDLIGYYCFGENAQVPGGRKAGLYQENFLDVGLGMKPSLTGQGKGLSFFQSGLAFAKANFQQDAFRLSVATFNKRAIAVYKNAGFETGEVFLNHDTEFVIMTYKENK